jgi:hypothetical protein
VTYQGGESGFDVAPAKYAWFLACQNPATTTNSHPILGEVPICSRCEARA